MIMDRGFFSTSNITSIAASKQQITFLQPLPFSLKATKELIKRNARKLKDVNTAFKYNEEIVHHTLDRITLGNQDYVHYQGNERKKLFEKYSIREMTKEMAKIKMIIHEKMEPFISEISKKQKDILKTSV